jgi:hypothetical protein
MGRQTLVVGAAIAVLASLAVYVSASAKDLGPSIEVPGDARVELLYQGHFTIKVAGRRGSAETFECTCTGGGTCEVNSIAGESGHRFVCLKGETGTCKSACSMTTGTSTQ